MKKHNWKWILGGIALVFAVNFGGVYLSSSEDFFIGIGIILGVVGPPFLIGLILDNVLNTKSRVSDEYSKSFSTEETGKKYYWKWVLGGLFAFFPALNFFLGAIANEFYAENFGNMICGWFAGFVIGALIDLNSKNNDMKKALATKRNQKTIHGSVVEIDGKYYRVKKLENQNDDSEPSEEGDED